jgi:hypothetical protein
MKKITLLLLLFVSTAFYAQSTGISYQAIIYNPNGEVIPGYNNSNSPLANKNICLQFTIVDSSTLVEYQEKITVRTDEFGMVNTVIGTGTRTGGYATSFGNINWSLPNKSMKVGLDTFGLCTNFIEISNQFFTGVPYAFAANSAENVTGIVPIQHGGTSANSVLGAKTNLGLENVDNTRDINKPISIATQAALNLKEDLSNKSTNVATDAGSNTKYPSVKAVKDYVDAGSTVQNTALTNEANIRAAADLLKEDLINKSTNVTTDGTSNTKYPSVKAVKDYVDSSINLGGTALTNEANIRAAADLALTNALNTEITNRINFDLLKEDVVNKSQNVNTDAASATKYPSVKAIKTYVDASDSNLTSNLNAETAARIAGDNTLTTNIAAEVTRATALDNTLTNNLLQELIRASAAENTLTTNLATEVSNRTNADLLKENLSNKSTNVTTDGVSDIKYPSVKSVKTYVDAGVATATTAVNNEASVRAAADATLTTNLATEITNRTNADLLKEDLANKSTNVTTDGTSNTKYPSVKAVKDYVDAGVTTATTAVNNEASVRAAADATLTTNLATEITNRTNADLLKEDIANKSTNVSTDGTSNTKYPSVKAVKDYVDAGVTTATTAVNNEAIVRAAADATLTTNLATEITNRTNADLLKEDLANKSTNVTTDGTSNTKYPSVKAVKDYVDAGIAAATIPDATTSIKGKLQLAGDLTGTAALPAIAVNAVTSAKILDGEIVNADVSATAAIADTKLATIATAGKVSNSATTATTTNTPNTIVLRDASGNLAAGAITATGFSGPLTGNVTGNVSGTAANVTGIVAIANGGTGSATQNFVDLTTAQTVAGAKTFSSNVTATSVTSPIYVSSPQALTSGSTISWNPANGLNASVTLTQNSTLSFSSTPIAGTYGTLVVTQDATGGRTLTLPSTANKVLGSASTTSIGLSSAAGAKDIINFYYDGSNCYWNIGQGYGIAAILAPTSLATEVTGTLPIANGGTGSSTQNFVDLTTSQTIAGNKTFSGAISAGPISAGDINAGAITANASISTEITTNLTINNANSELYKGKVLICNPTSPITITFNFDVPTGFNCMVLQKSADANKITFATGPGIVIKNRNNYTATAGNYAIATLVNIGGGIIVSAGDMQ